MTMLAPKQIARISGRSRPSLTPGEQETLFRALFETVPVGISHTEMESGRWLRMNPAVCEILGYSPRELSLLTWRDVTHPDDLEADAAQYERLLAGEVNSYKLIKRYLHKNGHAIWTRVSVSLVDNELAEPYIMAVAEDITTSVDHARALQESEERYRALVETSPDAIVVVCNHVCVYANQAAATIFDTDPATLMSTETGTLLAPGHEEKLTEAIVAAIESGAPVDIDGCWLRTMSEAPISANLQVSCGQVSYQGQPAVQLLLRDVSQQKASELSLLHQATHDSLTGLNNRSAFLEELTALLKQPSVPQFAVLLMDLDRFKDVNDTFGHHYGDLLLSTLGRRLVDAFDPRQVTTARLGGDEFAFVVRTGDPYVIAQSLLACVSESFQLDEHVVEIGGSIGIVVAPAHGNTANDLLRRADVAMYVAKHDRTGYALYDESRDHHSPERLRLVSDLRAAIGTDQLTLHYQPKAVIRTGEITSAEALIRWEHPTRGRIPPNDFVPVAEQSGLIGPITEWVLDEALKQVKKWEKSGRTVEIAVNLSSRSVYDDTLIKTVMDSLVKWQVDPQSLRLELTETAIMDDPNLAFETLSRIHEMGVKISIDDFGTGYSSLGYLTRLPVDEIKIDRGFVTDMRTKSQNAVIVRSTVELGHSLGLQVVAEGVEDQSTWELLGLLGCDVGQGYFLGKPAPAADLTPRLHRRNGRIQ